MAEKDLSYRLTADSRSFERGFKSAEASARAFERELARLEAEQRKVETALSDVGTVALGAGAAIAAGLVMATKAAISWESAWTGVAKVVDGTPEQMAALEEELRGLARVLPQTHEEIAGVAAAAAQLGVAREDLLDFTRTMVDLGVATNLSSEDAAFALARLMNIMETAPDDVGRLGAALVELGNNSATTEADIMEMALRIAGAAHTVRMSEADVLGWAAALSSVGIQAEAGGSAISRAFIAIEGAIRTGGAELETFAEVSGMTADEYRRAWQQDAARATAAFIEGLGRMQAAGGNVFATLKYLGLQEILLRDALLRLAGAGDLVSRSLDIANRGWEENSALLSEAENRYATVEARLQIARNNINDLAIDIGNTLLPVVGEAADLVSSLAEVFADMPGPIQAIVSILAALVAALALTGGTVLMAVPRITEYRQAIETLANSKGRLAAAAVATHNALGRVGSILAGPWGLAVAGAITVLGIFATRQAEARSRARELAETLDEQTGAITRDTGLWIANELAKRGVVAQADLLGISAADLTAAILGEADAVARVNAELNKHVGAVAPAYAQRSDDLDAASRKVRKGIADLSEDLKAARELYDQVGRATERQTKTTAELDPATRRLAETLNLSAVEAEQASKAISDLDKSLRALLSGLFGVEEAEDAATEAMRRMVEEARKNGGALEGNSRAALDNREHVRRLIAAHMELINALAASGASSEELTAKTQQLKNQFVAQARQAGLAKSAVDEYAKAYDQVPGLVSTTIKTEGLSAAYEQSKRYRDLIRSIPKEVETRLRVLRAGQVSPAGGMALGGQVKGYAGGGGVIAGPFGYDAVPIMAMRGEYISTVAATRANLAALEAANAGARLAVVGSATHRAAVASAAPINNTWNIYPQTAQFGPQELALVMAQQEARQRAGRPR